MLLIFDIAVIQDITSIDFVLYRVEQNYIFVSYLAQVRCLYYYVSCTIHL
jgi:hypothetical protein